MIKWNAATIFAAVISLLLVSGWHFVAHADGGDRRNGGDSGSSAGASASTGDTDNLGIGIPDAPSSAPGYLETAQLCDKYPDGMVCELALTRLQAQDGRRGWGARICSYSFGLVPFVRHYC